MGMFVTTSPENPRTLVYAVFTTLVTCFLLPSFHFARVGIIS
jgi:hypothetical protein